MNSMRNDKSLMTTTSLCLITFQTHKLSETTQHTSVWVGMLLIGENHQYTIMIGVGFPALVKIPSEASLTSQHISYLFLNPKLISYYSHKKQQNKGSSIVLWIIPSVISIMDPRHLSSRLQQKRFVGEIN